MTNANETETLVWIVTRDDYEDGVLYPMGVEGVFRSKQGAMAFVDAMWQDRISDYVHNDTAARMRWHADYNAHELAFGCAHGEEPEGEEELPVWTVRATGLGA